jgi:hypothetical protein
MLLQNASRFVAITNIGPLKTESRVFCNQILNCLQAKCMAGQQEEQILRHNSQGPWCVCQKSWELEACRNVGNNDVYNLVWVADSPAVNDYVQKLLCRSEMNVTLNSLSLWYGLELPCLA